MSILDAADTPQTEPLMLTICGHPGSGKTSLASTFPKPFIIRTQGEKIPRDLGSSAPKALGEVSSSEELFTQMKALMHDKHDFQTLIIDSVTGLENMFVQEVIEKDPKATTIQAAGGGYGAGRDMVTASHMRVRKGAEILREKRGMIVIFIAHADITRIEPPDSDGYTQYSLRLHAKSMSPYVDSVDVVGFLKQHTVVTGDERKRAVGGEDRVLVTYLTPTAITKNRLGIKEDLEVVQGENPFAPYLDGATRANEEEIA